MHEFNSNILVRSFFFLKKTMLLQRAFLTMFYTTNSSQLLSMVACYQVSFNANNYIEYLPIVSSAFKRTPE